MEPLLTPEQFRALEQMDTCAVANAIETFQVRLRNEGFSSDNGVKCIFKHLRPMLGYAVTGRIQTAAPPIASSLPPPHQLRFSDHTDWWNYVLSIPEPRIVVMQDVDRSPGVGSFMGEVHATICRALGCVAYVTNGAVRDLEAAEQMGFHFFAGHISVSHAYAHVVEFGATVEVGGLTVHPGDLVHGDRHGIQTIPSHIAAQIPPRVDLLKRREQAVLDFCRSPQFSVKGLQALVKELESSLFGDLGSRHSSEIYKEQQ